MFFDTSVLLAGLIELPGREAAAQLIMAAIARGRLKRPMTAWHCCLEFYSVATRLPQELRLTPADALALLEAEVLGRFAVLDLPPRRRVEFLRQAAAERTAGGRVYDAHIAAVARWAKAKLVVTDNRRHFDGLADHGIRVLTTSEFARQGRLS